MGRRPRPNPAWLVLAIGLLPAPALAQGTRAGIVTALEGDVTAVRSIAPRPVALKFRDDVFVRDRVVTGEHSFARLLLGGKAVVSIRERSAVTITEVPGRSTVEIESGKVALSVAQDRMRPGERIEIKMPNAIAGVRGTMIVAEVARSQSLVWLIRGSADVVHTSVAGAPLGPPQPLTARESFSADATTAARGTFTVDEVGAIVRDLQPRQSPDPGTDSQKPARTTALDAALTQMAALGPRELALLTGPAPSITAPDTLPDQTVTGAPLTPLTTVPLLVAIGAPPPAINPQPPVNPQPPPPPLCQPKHDRHRRHHHHYHR